MASSNSYQEDGRNAPETPPPGYPPPPPAYPPPPPQAYPPPPPGWQGYPGGYYPPPQAPKKKLSSAAITAIILAGVIVLGAAAAAVYYFVLKKDKGPEPTWPTTETRPPRTTAPTETEPVETEPQETEPEAELSVYAERTRTLDPYEIQHLGANPVYYYQHPTLDIAIDLRGEEEAARMMYVFPTETGFTVTHRQAISYAIGSLRDYPGGMDVESITVQIDLLSPEEEQAEIAAISTRRLEGEEVLVEWVRVKDGALYVRDNMAGGPDSAWYAKELYNSSVFFDHVYLSHHLVESAQPGVQVEETPGDANAEWAEIVSLLHTNPAEFEWRYSMPPYSRDPRPAVGLPNWAFLEDLSTVPIYEYGALDLNGDGFYEYLVHCCCDSYEYGPERYGYWVVFTETPYGLRLIGFCGSGEANLVYSDDHFYFLGARGQYGDNSFFAEEHSIPVPATYLRPLEYTYFTNLNELIIMESEGDSLDPWASWVIVPKHFTSDEGYEYFDYYVINSFEFWGVVGTLDGALSDRATVVPIRTPYTVPPGETVVQLQDPYRMRNFVDYLDSEFHYFPFAEQDWDNAVSVSSVLALGPPLTEDKVMSLLPHPELLDY